MMKLKAIIPCMLVCLAASCAHFPSSATKAHLEGTVVPEVDFRKADIRDVVSFLNGSMVMGQEQVPVIVLLLPHNQTVDPVTLQMRHASVSEILRVVSKLTDSRFYIRGNQPYLEPRHPRPMTPEELKMRHKAETDPFN